MDIRNHPCWRDASLRLSHRSGGFGGTCARCGTALIPGDANNNSVGYTKWEPVVEPKPFAPDSTERVVYDAIGDADVPMHNANRAKLAERIVAALNQ